MTIKELAAKFNISYQAASGLLVFLRETGAATQFDTEKIGKVKGKAPKGHKIDINKLETLVDTLRKNTVSEVIASTPPKGGKESEG
jgi:stringent starvation protein B